MIIGICVIELHVPSSRSLKHKRQVIKSLKDRIRLNFNVSVAEIDSLNLWQKATLGLAAVSNDKKYIDAIFEKIILLLKDNRAVNIIDYSVEILY
ncbi:MAG: DUF503 domain-containing protein [bacterium]